MQTFVLVRLFVLLQILMWQGGGGGRRGGGDSLFEIWYRKTCLYKCDDDQIFYIYVYRIADLVRELFENGLIEVDVSD